MLENVGNAITHEWTDWDETWVVVSHHVPGMSAMVRLPGPKIVCFLTQSVQLTLSSEQLTLLECVM